KSAVLGVAAGAAFSAVAAAAPCTQSAPAKPNSPGIVCPSGDTVSGNRASSPTGVSAAEHPGHFETPLPREDIIDAEAFSGDGIKITNLQATMTANRYVAAPFAPAMPSPTTEDAELYGPGYWSAKSMSHIVKRRPSVLGIGLVTAPSHDVKQS